MNREIYRFKLSPDIPMEDAWTTLFLAMLATECLYGRNRLLMDGAFYLDEKKRACVIDARDEVGQTMSRIFSGFLCFEYGEDALNIEFIQGPPKPSASRREVGA